MERLVFRNDDVSININPKELSKIYGIIHNLFPDAEIWSCVTLFAKRNPRGSIYPLTPFKHNSTNWFYKTADSFMYDYRHPFYKVASHGLYHIDHASVPRTTQEMSIIGSCSFLKTDLFIPPFNSFNQDTIDICFDNNIKMKTEGWKSLEHNDFDSNHKFWYWHSWRFSGKQLQEKLSADRNSKNVGLVQTDAN